MLRTCLIAAFAVASAPALADVTIVKAGPHGDVRPKVEAALRDVERAMTVCWRGTPPPSVRIAVAVNPDGVVDAIHLSKGGAAQCAAGILAVWTLPGGPWSGHVEIVPHAASDGAASEVA